VTQYDLRHRIQADTDQKAVAVRDRIAKLLEEDEDVNLVQTDHAQVNRVYTVKAYDTAKGERVEQMVEAESAEAAWDEIESDTVTVIHVQTPITEAPHET